MDWSVNDVRVSQLLYNVSAYTCLPRKCEDVYKTGSRPRLLEIHKAVEFVKCLQQNSFFTFN